MLTNTNIRFQVIRFIEIYKNANSHILHASEKIFDSKFVNLTVDEPITLTELNKFMSSYRKTQIADLLQLYNEIVDDIVKVYRGFEQYLDSVSKYVPGNIFSFYMIIALHFTPLFTYLFIN